MKIKQNLTIPKGTKLQVLSKGYYCTLKDEIGNSVQFIIFDDSYVKDHPELFSEDVKEVDHCTGCKNVIDCPYCVNGSYRRIS